MHAGQRDLDIVVYGATGFLGKLTAQYLATAAREVRIGLAGRSADRLGAARQYLGPAAQDWPLIVADVSEAEALRDLAARTRVVISTVGPYAKCGLPVVAACAAAGTDYVDLAGETPFVRASIDRYHEQAAENGARIVHSCGFDSVPSDLTVYALHRRALEDATGELTDTTFVLRASSYAGGFSGGMVSAMAELLQSSSDSATRRLLDDPYSLSPDRGAEPELGSQPDLQLRRGADIAPELAGVWTGGYLMGLYNTRCVRRTNALLDWAYGRRFRYSETLSMGSTPIAPMAAVMTNFTLAGATRFGGRYLDMLPPGFLDSVRPAPGIGRTEGEQGYYKVETYTTTTHRARYVATMTQKADPGYTATALMLGESALALITDRDRLADRYGVLTPAVALGDALLARLPAAGVTLKTGRLN
jgi:saccharopine dehydrogenase (NAD+, L-lysine-forming)